MSGTQLLVWIFRQLSAKSMEHHTATPAMMMSVCSLSRVCRPLSHDSRNHCWYLDTSPLIALEKMLVEEKFDAEFPLRGRIFVLRLSDFRFSWFFSCDFHLYPRLNQYGWCVRIFDWNCEIQIQNAKTMKLPDSNPKCKNKRPRSL